MRYLSRLRIAEAGRLLDAGRLVSEVATCTGFSSASHLSVAFYRETGIRPSRYRSW
ncbi:helix-turn-helix domain-containing protein [Streptomyces sp. NPDC051639]|uniref:helix-turn-helix domain-containing protein n=1 Tax=Streptomyces sp. NPDC051639 TaxID=3155671 RepID=UPI0034182855